MGVLVVEASHSCAHKHIHDVLEAFVRWSFLQDLLYDGPFVEMIRAELKNRVVGVRPSGAAGHTATTPTADSAPGEGSPGAPADQDAARTLEHDLEVPYDLLIGADGTESTVRRILKVRPTRGLEGP